MDGRTGDLVDRGAGGGEIVTLGLGQPIGQRHAKFGRDLAGREVGDELSDTGQQLTRGEFGEGDCGNGTRRDAFCEHGGDAPGHDGGLARTGAGLNQDRPIVEADRGAARTVIFQHCGHAAHHSASQI